MWRQQSNYLAQIFETEGGRLQLASVPVVSIQKPEIGNIELYTGLTGTVEPSDIVYIIPKAAGEVTDVYVKAGDYVEEGQESPILIQNRWTGQKSIWIRSPFPFRMPIQTCRG